MGVRKQSLHVVVKPGGVGEGRKQEVVCSVSSKHKLQV